MTRGSCLCGDVAWEVGADFARMSHCHCSVCRKLHGTAFATYAAAPAEHVRFTREGDMRVFESTPGVRRRFCGRCGSVLPSLANGPNVILPVGCLDDDPGLRPQRHIRVGSKAPWYEIADALPRFEKNASGEGAADPPVRRAAPRTGPGVVAGSCQCGAAAYELTGEMAAILFCHCSRCRKARSAAHGANLFARAHAFRWVRGDDHVCEYVVPGAEFTASFCDTCGSSLPLRVPRGELVKAPAGGLDADPGARPTLHIYVGSKAPWFEIADALPQFDTLPDPG